jgi:ATP-binding cassette subfamily F protein 3
MGYFDQNSASIDSDKTVAEHFGNLFPEMTQKELRKTLGAYLFSGSAAEKRVSSLSGGEKARLVLAELLCSRPNLLLLDEPTNHMDIPAKETLESAFCSYTGTILFVSHDRYFVQQVADAVLVLDGHDVMYYPFGYAHYISRKRGAQGENLSAMIQAEEQALIAELKAVPKAERHRLKEINTEEAYLDWKLGLMAEPLALAQKRYELVWESFQTMCTAGYQAGWEAWILECAQKEKELQEAQENWTQCCLQWYEEYLQMDETGFYRER